MENAWESVLQKIYTSDSLLSQVKNWKAEGLKIVFTNGCFDLIHMGHLQYLSAARALGDKLIIGINSDESVRKLKGNHRPIKEEKTRLALLASLSFVNAVILFSEETPLNLIKSIEPEILCKGGDWTVDQIVGATEVVALGGKVKSIPFLKGHSTTSLEQKIKSHI